MKKVGFLVVFIIIGLFLLLSKKPQRKIAYNEHSLIYAFGDSLTFGYGSSKSYPQYLTKILGVKVHNLGISGERTEQGLVRLKNFFSRKKADIIILIHGGNDFLQKKTIKKTKENLEKMIEFLISKNIKIIFMGMPSSAIGVLVGANKIYTELSQKYNLVYNGETMSSLLRTKKFKSDSIHFNEKGYKKLAEAISLLLEREIE